MPAALGGAAASAPVYGYGVVAVRAHDPTWFTEGLAYRDQTLLESGVVGRSSKLGRVRLPGGQREHELKLPAGYTAEGVTVLGDRVFQLTLAEQTAFVYDLRTFRRLRTFRYAGQGWGLANDGASLIVSNGSATLQFRDPKTFWVRRTLTVRDAGKTVFGLNELEVVKGRICANVFPTDRIACIDPASGQVRYWLDLSGLLPPALRTDEGAVLNGIAYDAGRDRLFVTGKLWPRLYEIRRGTAQPS